MWPFRSAISDKWKIVLLDVIQKRQEKKAILAAASVRNSAPHQKTTPTRTSRKDKVSVEWVRPTECGNFLSFPVSYWSKLNIWYLAFLLMDMDQVYIIIPCALTKNRILLEPVLVSETSQPK